MQCNQGDSHPPFFCQQVDVLAAIAKDALHFKPPDGESQAEVEARVAGLISQQVLPALEPGGPAALLVMHGMAIKW
jgi:broad specificity phosphatase PhoE